MIKLFKKLVKPFFKKEEPTFCSLPNLIDTKKKELKKPKKTKGAFGKCHNQDYSNYNTLKVVPRSKRTKENCNSVGISNTNPFKKEI